MSSIAPNGTVRFLTGVPLDENYENSLDFITKEAQTSFFLGLTPVHVSNNCTRVRDGVIRVDALVETLLPCNYIMFQNTNFGASPFKWFYAFITNIEYVNNNMSYVYYTIDDIQTWLFDVQLKECFVEREHTATDRLFEHLVDEGIATSEYVNKQLYNKTYNRYVYCLFTSTTIDQTEEAGQTLYIPVTSDITVKAGQLNGLTIITGDLQNNNGDWYEITGQGWAGNDLDRLNETIKLLTKENQKDSIVGLITFPKHFSPEDDIAHNPVTDSLEYSNFASGDTLDGYTPKNNKMYNSPFCLFEFGTNEGQKEMLQPEYLLTSSNGIEIYSNCSPSPSLMCVPLWYENENYCYKKAINLDTFPQAPLSINGYSAWVASGGLAKQMVGAVSGVAGGVLNTGGALASGNPVGVVAGIVNTGTSVANSIINIDVAKHLPSEVKGSMNTTPLSANRKIGLYVRKMTINKDVAKSIDDYFTMFGYKVNKVKTPSRRNRPHYTYLKTKGCHVDGGAPADAIRRIEQIYDNGIRFWVNASEVGQYTTINNSPL